MYLRPRVLRNVLNRDLQTTLLGYPVNQPIGISPTAWHSVFHPDGEEATAKGKKANFFKKYHYIKLLHQDTCTIIVLQCLFLQLLPR